MSSVPIAASKISHSQSASYEQVKRAFADCYGQTPDPPLPKFPVVAIFLTK